MAGLDTSRTTEIEQENTSKTIKSDSCVIMESDTEFPKNVKKLRTHKVQPSDENGEDRKCRTTVENHDTSKITESERGDTSETINNVDREENNEEQPSVKKAEESRWRTNVENHVWLNEKPNNLGIKERTVDMDRWINEHTAKENDSYRMTEGGEKICLIIGNIKYKNTKNCLEGCEKDCQYLSALFTQLGFDVELQKNLTAEDITKSLEEKKKAITNNTQCFVCAITSHGNCEGVKGTDKSVIKFQTILDMFNKENCRELADKPKVFLFDVCRGENTDMAKARILKDIHEAAMPPINSDVLVAHATSHDYVSFTHSEYGSWFCRSFVKVVSENACNLSLSDMILKVNGLVGTFMSEDGCMQSARFDCSMRKLLFFNVQVKENATKEKQNLPDADENKGHDQLRKRKERCS